MDSHQNVLSANLAARVIHYVTHSPITLFIAVILLGLGSFALSSIIVEDDTAQPLSVVEVSATYPSISSEQTNALVVKPLEKLIKRVAGVGDIYSVNSRENAQIRAYIDSDKEPKRIAANIRETLSANRDTLPSDITDLSVKSKTIADVPLINVVLWSEKLSDSQLRQLALAVLQNLQEIDNTSQGMVIGGRKEIFHIDILPEKMFAYGITPEQLLKTIRGANGLTSVGQIESGDGHINIYSGKALSGVDDIKRLPIINHQSSVVYVQDVANVFYGAQAPEQLVMHYGGMTQNGRYMQGGQAVTLAIDNTQGSNGIEVANAVIAKLDALKGYLISDDVNVDVIKNNAEITQNSTNTLVFYLITAMVILFLAFAMLLSVRQAVTMITVMVLLASTTFFCAWLLGLTINRVMMAALIASLGWVASDAVFVIEGIYRQWFSDKKPTVKAVIESSVRLTKTMVWATLIAVVVLIVLLMAGAQMVDLKPLLLLLPLSIAVSFVIVFVFIPYLLIKFKPSPISLETIRFRQQQRYSLLTYLEDSIKQTIDPSGKRNFLLKLMAVFAVVAVMFYTIPSQIQPLPKADENEFSIQVDLPDGSALTRTVTLLNQMAERIITLEGVKTLQVYAGVQKPIQSSYFAPYYHQRSQPSQGEIVVQLFGDGKQNGNTEEIIEQINQIAISFSAYEDAKTALVSTGGSVPIIKPIVAEIYGHSTEQINKLTRQVTHLFNQSELLSGVDNSLTDIYPVQYFQINTIKAAHYGVSNETIRQALAIVMGAQSAGDIQRKNALETSPITIKIPFAARSQLNRLKQLPIVSVQGDMVPLSELGHFTLRKQDDAIYRKNIRQVAYVSATLSALSDNSTTLKTTLDSINTVLADNDVQTFNQIDDALLNQSRAALYQPYVVWNGQERLLSALFDNFYLFFLAAIAMVYLLTLWRFNSFIMPLIALFPVSLAAVGVVVSYWFFNFAFNPAAAVGVLILIALMTKHSLILIEQMMQHCAIEKDFIQVTTDATLLSIKPIVTSTLLLTVIFGVILFDKVLGNMAIVVLSGLLPATIAMFYLLPLIVLYFGEGVVNKAAANLGYVESAPSDKDNSNAPAAAVNQDGSEAKHSEGAATKATNIRLNVSSLLKKRDNSDN